GLDPTVVIGGRLKATGSNAKLGQGKFLVAEADESDGSFLKLSPTIAIVTNIDREHMDFFKTMDSLKEAFLSFVNKVPFYGVSIVCIEDEHLRGLLPSVHRRYITYGFTHQAELHAINIKKGVMSVSFEVIYKNRNIGDFDLPVPGVHNVLNSLAAIGTALELQIDVSRIRDALKGFGGIQRRFEFKGKVEGIKIFDDYGHHPTEIKATLKAAKEGITGERLFVIFQPHRYTRTKDLMDEFSSSFNDADSLILLDIYSAGEKPIEGISTAVLFERIKKAGHNSVVYMKDREEAIGYISSNIQRGDVLLTLGAGDVWKIGEEILKRLTKPNDLTEQRNRHPNRSRYA
ncbi:MAG: UDP-N-acetylmuramate--L-alanine ligase, partial [Nitrospirota bacterium]